jgi:hypothetical protein
MKGDVGKRAMVRLGITNVFLNTIITALQGRQWEMLLQRFVQVCIPAFRLPYVME